MVSTDGCEPFVVRQGRNSSHSTCLACPYSQPELALKTVCFAHLLHSSMSQISFRFQRSACLTPKTPASRTHVLCSASRETVRRTLLLTGILAATQLPARADFASQLAQFSSPKGIAPVDAVVKLLDAASVLKTVQVRDHNMCGSLCRGIMSCLLLALSFISLDRSSGRLCSRQRHARSQTRCPRFPFPKSG